MPRKPALSEALRERWDSPAGLALRRETRKRQIAALLAKFPISADEANQIRALLPEPGREP
jgi:hypothetical protein